MVVMPPLNRRKATDRRDLQDRRAGVDRRFQGDRRLMVVAVVVERRAGADRRAEHLDRRLAVRRSPSDRRTIMERRRAGRRA